MRRARRVDLSMIGLQSGRLTVVAKAAAPAGARSQWVCKCSCGGIAVVDQNTLHKGHKQSCGCLRREIDVNKAIVGKRFHRWTVLSYMGGKRPLVLVRCDCGVLGYRKPNLITGGGSMSCGCLRSEVTAARSTKHGGARTPEYRIWSGMNQRCSNEAMENYRYYGGRGVSVSPVWRNDFARFYRDMGPRPSAAHSIDRIDPFGHYEPGNCRWATRSEQMRNQRRQRAKG